MQFNLQFDPINCIFKCPYIEVMLKYHFTLFGELFKGSKFKRYRHIIWLATTWSIWRTRNNIIFRGDSVNVSTLLDQIIYIAWFWYIGRGGFNTSSTFSDWCNNNPLDFFDVSWAIPFLICKGWVPLIYTPYKSIFCL
jgi:hypothetical protein